MKKTWLLALAATAFVFSANTYSATGPFDGSTFKGRIALSHDGNFNDEDDWGAFPVAIAILVAFGVKDKLVHIDFNNIIQNNDARFEKEMTASVLGAAEKYGIPISVLHNCRTDLDGAINSIRDAINASSRENPLYFVLAGPMDVPHRGIQAADPAKRQYVYCISHSSWNDGYGQRKLQSLSKRELISLGIHWVQVKPGSLLAHGGVPATKSTPEQWALFQWMRDSGDERLKWIYTRLQAEERCDVSDATMDYFLMTGDEACNPEKLAALLDKKQKPKPVAIRPVIRLEAENFPTLQNYSIVTVGRKVSQNLIVRMSDAPKGTIRTILDEPYSAVSGRYEVGVQYRDAKDGAATFALRVNGVQQGESWKGAANDDAWKTQTFKDVLITEGDVIEVQVTADGAERGDVDYVELKYLGLDDPAAGAGHRLYNWTSAMANMYAANAYLRPDKTNIPAESLRDAGRIRTFMEQTDFFRMSPKSDLKSGSTRYVLANEPNSYIAYSNNAADKMGVRNLQAGAYLLRWFDTTNGRTVEQVVAVAAGDQAWDKPNEIGAEVALYVKRLEGLAASGSK